MFIRPEQCHIRHAIADTVPPGLVVCCDEMCLTYNLTPNYTFGGKGSKSVKLLGPKSYAFDARATHGLMLKIQLGIPDAHAAAVITKQMVERVCNLADTHMQDRDNFHTSNQTVDLGPCKYGLHDHRC